MNKVRRETAVLHAGGPRRKANTEPWEPIQGGTTLRCRQHFLLRAGVGKLHPAPRESHFRHNVEDSNALMP